jgi:hypothetical protein
MVYMSCFSATLMAIVYWLLGVISRLGGNNYSFTRTAGSIALTVLKERPEG